MSIESMTELSWVMYGISGAFAVAAVVLFFALDIAKCWRMVSGRRAVRRAGRRQTKRAVPGGGAVTIKLGRVPIKSGAEPEAFVGGAERTREMEGLTVGQLGTEGLAVGDLETQELDIGDLETERLGLEEPETRNLYIENLDIGELGTRNLYKEKPDQGGVETQDLHKEGVETQALDIEEMGTGRLYMEELGIGELETEEQSIENLETQELDIGDLETERLGLEEPETRNLYIENLDIGELGTRNLYKEKPDQGGVETQALHKEDTGTERLVIEGLRTKKQTGEQCTYEWVTEKLSAFGSGEPDQENALPDCANDHAQGGAQTANFEIIQDIVYVHVTAPAI